MTMTVWVCHQTQLPKKKECLPSLNNRYYEVLFLGDILKGQTTFLE